MQVLLSNQNAEKKHEKFSYYVISSSYNNNSNVKVGRFKIMEIFL